MTGALALVAALTISSQIQTHPAGLDSIGPSRGRSLRTAPIMDKLYQQANKPALDFNFARFKDLHDDATGKTSLVTFSRSAAQSPGTYVGSDGLIHDAAVNLALYSEQFDNAWWGVSNTTVSANQVIAPDGKQTSDFLRETTANGQHVIFGSISTSKSRVYTFSAYVKEQDRRYVMMQIAPNSATARHAVVFDLQSLAVTDTEQVGSPTSTSQSIVDAGNGWRRISVSANHTSGIIYSVFGISDSATPSWNANAYPTYLGDTAKGAHIWGAQLEETDASTMEPTAYIHTTSQALAAPRFDHTPTTGNLTTNLLTYSEMLDVSSAWTSNRVSITANDTTSPDGTTTAEKIEATSTTYLYVRRSGYQSGVHTASIYVKNDDWPYVALRNENFAFFDLSTGTVMSTQSGVTATITDVGNGWFRLTNTYNRSGSFAFVGVDYTDASSNQSVSPPAGVGFWAWGAQLEASPTAGPYVRTLGETRSISDAVAPSLGLLVEEQRTNSETQSVSLLNYDNNASATTNSTVTLGQADPWGGTNAGLFEGDGSGISYSFGVVKSSADTETFSVWLKAGTTSLARIQIGASATTQGVYANVDLSAGTIGPASVAGGSFTAISSSIQAWGNGWYRCSVSATSPSGINRGAYITFPSANTTDNYYFAAPQWEVGAFPTSYIPTTGSAQTRYADIAAVQDEDFSTTNLLAYSDYLAASVWIGRSFATPVDLGFTGPDGAQAWSFTEDSSSVNPAIYYNADVSDGTPRTFSVWLKASSPATINLSTQGNTSTSTISLTTSWQKFFVTDSINSGTGPHIGGFSTLSVGSGITIYVSMPQITATEYPVEYTTTRNLLTDSQDFERSGWIKTAGVTFTADVSDPNGGNNGSEATVSTTAHAFAQQKTVLASTDYVFSFWAKRGTMTDVKYSVYCSTTASNIIGPTSYYSSINSNTWTRVSFPFTTPAGCTSVAAYILRDSLATGTMYAYGAQMEPGSTATDYVRTVDTVGKAYGFYEPTEGTVFVDFANTLQTGNIRFAQLDDGTESNRLQIGRDSGASVNNAAVVLSGSVQYNNTFSDLDDAVIASAFKYNSANSAQSGTLSTPDTIVTLPIFTTLRFGGTSGNLEKPNGHIKRLTYWPVRQSDSTLQVITQ